MDEFTPESRFLIATLIETPDDGRLNSLAAEVTNWEVVVALTVRNEVVAQLHRALLGNIPAVPVQVAAQVRELFAAITLRNMQLARELDRLTAMLLAAGIPSIPWKGPALAAQLYGDIALRSYVDLDLFVPPQQCRAALQVLAEAGYLPDFPLPEKRWPALLRVVSHLTLKGLNQGWMVELHWTPFHPISGFFYDLSPRWQSPADSGSSAQRFSAEELLVLLCIHATVHRWEKLKWVVDIDRLLRRQSAVDWGVVFAIAARAGALRCVRLGLLLAHRLCATPLPGSAAVAQDDDLVAARLAAVVKEQLLSTSCRQLRGIRAVCFDLQCRERWRDRIRQGGALLFAPRQADWLLFPAGDAFYPLYYLERPLRMVWKWGVRFCLRG